MMISSFNAQEDTGVPFHRNFNSILRRDHQINFQWAWRLWVGRRKEPILGYVPKNDEKKNLVHKGLNIFFVNFRSMIVHPPLFAIKKSLFYFIVAIHKFTTLHFNHMHNSIFQYLLTNNNIPYFLMKNSFTEKGERCKHRPVINLAPNCQYTNWLLFSVIYYQNIYFIFIYYRIYIYFFCYILTEYIFYFLLYRIYINIFCYIIYIFCFIYIYIYYFFFSVLCSVNQSCKLFVDIKLHQLKNNSLKLDFFFIYMVLNLA